MRENDPEILEAIHNIMNTIDSLRSSAGLSMIGTTHGDIKCFSQPNCFKSLVEE